MHPFHQATDDKFLQIGEGETFTRDCETHTNVLLDTLMLSIRLIDLRKLRVTKPNVLFVCSKNQWRSPTAEAIYRHDDRIAVRSRGTANSAARTIRLDDVVWADVILVMEDKHRQRILANFPDPLKFLPIHALDIPDDYAFMDEELVELIRSATEPILDSIMQ